MFRRKGNGPQAIKVLKVLRTLGKGKPVVDPSQGKHKLGLW